MSFSALLSAAARRLWLWRNRRAFKEAAVERKPRLLVDVSVIMRHDAATGIQRVVRSIWSHLETLELTDFELVPVYAGRTRGYCFAPADFLNRREAPGCTPVGAGAGDKFLGLDLAAHYLPQYRKQLAAWQAHGASLHFIVYDLLPLSRPDWFEPSTARRFERWFETVVMVADQALCISEDVANELRRRTVGAASQPTLQVARLRLSGDIAGSVPSAGLSIEVKRALDWAQTRTAILMVGTVEPRKGYDKALDAFEQLWAADDKAPDLIIVGKPGWKTSALQDRIRRHAEQGRRLHWLEAVSDEALIEFYDLCTGVFLASFDEGFGLPLIEAATHGRWVLARDLPVFREQRLANVRYFRDDSPATLGSELLALVRIAEAGAPAHIVLPSWNECVRQMLRDMAVCDSSVSATVLPLRKAS